MRSDHQSQLPSEEEQRNTEENQNQEAMGAENAANSGRACLARVRTRMRTPEPTWKVLGEAARAWRGNPNLWEAEVDPWALLTSQSILNNEPRAREGPCLKI